MKIAEIKPGQRVGVVKGRKADYRELPREAEVVEIVTKEERIWASNAYVEDNTPRFRKVRYVKLLLDTEPLEENKYGDRYSHLHNLPKGSTVEVEPQQIVGLWSALKGGVMKQIEAIREKKAGQAALEAKLIAHFGKRMFDDYITARYDGRGQSPTVEFYGKATDRLFEELARP